ncbi:hypothetical protein NM208_g7216 [Fusarium decemcellulare]|uniref:Uncharacterized protein n=1 Tax=Fusarium decemcellulare TaxID=57161 RepID=A0ACC1SAH1_9HYPO|nr:hypothetical protein NM208_g7216 [Fusarium decemcellulare]
MAEVLGIVAGATQLLDLSARVLVASSRLYSKLKNVPGEIETLKKNTQQFIDLLWMISSDFDISLGPQGNPLHVAHRVTSILHDAMDESEELALLLERLSVHSSSSVKRVWSVVVSAKQERDIAERCQRIESLKSSLQLWYQHQSSVRMRKVEQQLQVLSLLVMFGFQLGRWALSMTGSISPHNVVDPKRSPAFIAIEEARGAVQDCLYFNQGYMYKGALGGLRPSKLELLSAVKPSSAEKLESILETLLRKLIQAYEEGRASPTDRTPYGTSPLEVRRRNLSSNLTSLLLTYPKEFCLLTFNLGAFQEGFHDVLVRIVEALVTGSSESRDQRALQIAVRVAGNGVWSYQKLQALKLDGILLAQGYCTADLVQRADMTPENIALLAKNPILLEDYGQQPIHVAVLGRSENELRRLVSLDKVDSKAKNPPILGLAVGWTTGLEILLDAGAEPEDAILVAIYQQHLPSIEILLDHGCPIFKVDSKVYSKGLTETDLLASATEYSDSSWDVVCLLIQKLVEKRHELFRLAQKHLSDACLQTFGYCKKAQPPSLIDYHALGIFEELVACGVKVPKALWPGRYATIYHHSRMTYGLAKKLFDNGFHDIDKPDDKGRTPLLIAAREYSELEGTGQTYGLKKMPGYAAVWTYFCDFIQKGRSNGTIAAAGVAPQAALLLRRRRRWLFLLARYTSLGLSLDHESFTDICRLEIFDRLGMAHTCCDRLGRKHDCRDLTDQDVIDHGNEAGADETGCNCLSLSSEELLELQEEDKDLNSVLESYVQLYLDLLQTHYADFEVFWLSWWLTLEYYLPFESTNQPEIDPLSFVEKLHIPIPIQLVGVCDPETYYQETDPDFDSYGPQTETIVSTVNRCVAALNADGAESILHQLVPDSDEQQYNRTWFHLDMTENEDEDLVSEV